MEIKLTARQSTSSFNTNHLGSDLQTTPALTLHRLLIYGAWQTAQAVSPLAQQSQDDRYDIHTPALPSPVTRVSQLLALLSTTRVIMAERAQGRYSVVSYGTILGREALEGIEAKKSSQ